MLNQIQFFNRFNTGTSGFFGDGFTGPASLSGLLTWISAGNPANTVGGGVCTVAADKSGNGRDWVRGGSVAGIPVNTTTAQYPDVGNDVMVDLPSLATFDLTAFAQRLLRCEGVMTGLTEWTMVTLYRIKSYNSVDDDKFVYWVGASGMQVRDYGARYYYNGTSYGTNSAGFNVRAHADLWRVVVESYYPPVGDNTARHFVMQNGVVEPVTKNTAGAVTTDPTNYGWAGTGNDYLPRNDNDNIGIGTVDPETLSHWPTVPCVAIRDVMCYGRALSLNEAKQLTEWLLGQVYSAAPPFLKTLHCMGDSIHQESGGVACTNGYYYSDLSSVRRFGTMFVNTAQGGNSIELQAARSYGTAGRMRKTRWHQEVALSIQIGTNNPSDSAAVKWTKTKVMLENSLVSGAPTHIFVGDLLAAGTNATTPDVSRSANHASYNTLMRAGMASGGDFYDAHPEIGCGVLEYATSIPSYFEVPIAVLDPATASTTMTKTVGDTTPSDVTNAAQRHYSDGLHPKVITRPNGTLPIYARLGMYDKIKEKMDTAFWA